MASPTETKPGNAVLMVSIFHRGEFFGTECYAQNRVVIGRSLNADIQISTEWISRSHAAVRILGSRILIDDLGSLNGTFVNGKRIKRAYVEAKDVVGFGDYALVFKLIDRESSRVKPGELDLSTEWEATYEVSMIRGEIKPDVHDISAPDPPSPQKDRMIATEAAVKKPVRRRITKVTRAPDQRITAKMSRNRSKPPQSNA